MKILFLPKYTSDGASSRYRIYQYLEQFSQMGIVVSVKPFFYKSSYIKNFEQGKFLLNYFSLPLYIVKRISLLFYLRKYDLVVIEKEAIPYFPAVFEYMMSWLKVKFILDYDDAIFHNYDFSGNYMVRLLFKNKIPYIMRKADGIITGSPYLTEYARRYNSNVCEMPTSVDLERYVIQRREYEKFVIGWIGSRSTSIFIMDIYLAIKDFAIKYHDEVEFRLIGFTSLIPDGMFFPDNVKIVTWTSEAEIEELNGIDLGIMPLRETPFTKGKCGFKLIQYMACAKPTISTPLEANVKINRDSHNLFASTYAEWISGFEVVLQQQEKYKQIGAKNRLIVETYYTLQANLNQYVNFYAMVIGRKK